MSKSNKLKRESIRISVKNFIFKLKFQRLKHIFIKKLGAYHLKRRNE